jgi:hypothetical protein
LHSQDGARLHALAANDTSPTFSLTLSPGTRNKVISEYRVGDNMWMTIVMTNLTNHDIDCSMDGDSGYNRMFDYEAIDEDGKSVEKRHHGTEGYQHGCGIGAGGNIPSEFLLDRVFKLDRPGKYVIRVSRPEPFVKDDKGEHPVIWSNPITINIIG